MNDLVKIAVVGLALLALAGCGKKPAARNADSQQPAAVQSGNAASANLPATGPSPQDCSSIPDKVSIQHGIEDAMKAIYGLDAGPAKFVVVRVTPADCEHVTVTYRMQGPGAASESAQMTVGDGGKWFITLFNKPHPIP
ncbi:MAG TPA: hypothetical protein VMF58_12230 [Rhizomicrobium sp.]|nr:hypothetical protein [Rhizomicrobium sp.]